MVRILPLIVALLFSLVTSAEASQSSIEVGQAWSFHGAPSKSARVIIGKIETDVTPRIVHVVIDGLPRLDRDPGALKGGLEGRGAGRNEDRFWCKYKLTPSPDGSGVDIVITYMPIEYMALAESLDSIVGTGVSTDLIFERAYDGWDYLRDEGELETAHAVAASKPLSKSVAMVLKSASSTISVMERIWPEIEKSLAEERENFE